MYQAVRRRPFTSEIRVRSKDSPCGLYGGQRNSERFLSEYFRCSLSTNRIMLHNYFNPYTSLISRIRGEESRKLQRKQGSFAYWRVLLRKVISSNVTHQSFNHLRRKPSPFYLKPQSVPRSKHLTPSL